MTALQVADLSYPVIAQQQLKNIRKLGAGSFADVWLCWYTPADGSPRFKVAAKYVKPEILTNESELQLFLKEVDTLKSLRNRYIVQLIGVGAPAVIARPQATSHHASKASAADTPEEAAAAGPFASYLQGQVDEQAQNAKHVPLFLVQEYLAGGALNCVIAQDMIRSPWQREQYTLADSLRWASNIAEALVYLHTNTPKVIHRDLKLSNILLTRDNYSLAEARVADFGLHTCVPEQKQQLLSLSSSQITTSSPNTALNSQDNSGHSNDATNGFSNGIAAPAGLPSQPGTSSHLNSHLHLGRNMGVNLDPSYGSQYSEAGLGEPGGTAGYNAVTAGVDAATASVTSSTAHCDSVPVSAREYLRVQSARLVCNHSYSTRQMHSKATRTLSVPRLLSVTSAPSKSHSVTNSGAVVELTPYAADSAPDATAALHALISHSCKDALKRKGAFGRSFRQQYSSVLRAQLTYPPTVNESVREGASGDSSTVGARQAGPNSSSCTTAALASPAGGVVQDDSAFKLPCTTSSPSVSGLTGLRVALSNFSSITTRSHSSFSARGASVTSIMTRGSSASSSKAVEGRQAAVVLGQPAESVCEAVFQLTARTGSLVYMAPEVFLGKSYNEKADVYSFGIMLYELLHHQLLQLSIGAVANDGQAALQLYAVSMAEDGFRPPISPKLPQKLQDVIAACWAQQPGDRPSMQVVLEQLQGIQKELRLNTNGAGTKGNRACRTQVGGKDTSEGQLGSGGSACCGCLGA